MTRKLAIQYAVSAIIVCSLIPRFAAAQSPLATAAAASRGGPFAYLGIENVRCNCTFRTDDDGNHDFQFRSNPVVLGVFNEGPADGSLMRGDTITAIDGFPLLSPQGGRRLANIRPGQKLTLNVSRGRAHLALSLRAERGRASGGSVSIYAPEASEGTWTYDFPAPPVPSIAPIPPVPPVGAIAPVPPVPPVPESPASPIGWFGFSVRCNQCGWSQGRGDESPVWESAAAPELSMVAKESPAGRAGLLAGDLVTHIDGVSILSPKGARKFGAVKPGQTVRLTVLRDGRSLTREMTLATRPEVRAALAAVNAAPHAYSARRELRYTGKLDNVSVEVWSAGGPTVERVGDTMLITVGSSVIRLKVNK